MNITLTQLVNLICFVQVFAFCIFLVRNIHMCKPNFYLAIFFIAQLILVGKQLVGLKFGPHVQNYLDIFSYPVYWIVVPSVLLYIQSKLLYGFKFKKQLLLHFIPSIIVLLYCTFFALKVHYGSKGQTIIFSSLNFAVIWEILLYLMYIYFLIYTLLAIRIIRKFQHGEINHVIHKTNKTLKWLKIFVYGFFISWLINAIIIYAYQLEWLPDIFPTAAFALIFPFFLFFNTVFYYAWENPQPFKFEEKNGSNSYEPDIIKLKKYAELLTDFMDKYKPYLNPDLSMNKLSEQVGIPMKYLSKILNTLFEQNFNDFINYYRTKEVTDALSNTEKLDTDLVSLALDCGFNSKATFFRIFKKNTGLTPLQFFENIQFKQQELLSEAC